MPKITIVTHCWAVDKPQYAVFLRAQLTSILTRTPDIDAEIVVCCYTNDDATMGVLRDLKFPMSISAVLSMSPNSVWRRAIGRNSAIRTSAAKDSDLMWFTDCDYLFGDRCLGDIYEAWMKHGQPAMIFPKGYYAHADKAAVDVWVENNINPPSPMIIPDRTPMVWTRCGRAIGGLQCVSGAWAREHGYLPNSKWQNPPDRPFPDFRDDVAFRKSITAADGRIVGIDHLAGFYRLRHTEVGYGK